MRCRLLLPLVLFSLVCVSPVLASWYLDAETVTIQLDVQSGLKVIRTGPDYNLEYLTANISFIPLNLPHQEVISLALDPQPDVHDDNYVFRWDEPVPTNPGFSVDAKMKVTQVQQTVGFTKFPYTGFSDEIRAYTTPQETIDSDSDAVVAKASELAAGETDYYRVVFKMAEWTKANVNYDLSTLTQKASQKASWVLATRSGVCDEITTLFVALLRAVGIPARFVAGIAYTESPLFPQNWGGHGWAEVYFPDAGWVPFDVTYGELGFVDPTHIILKRSFDSGEPDTRYTWLGRDVEITTLPIRVDAELLDTKGKMAEKLTIGVRAEQDFVGIGSYNLLDVALTNPTSSYIATQVQVANIAEMEMMDDQLKYVLVEPFGTAHAFWLVKVRSNLDEHYTYSFPILAATFRNRSASTSFSVLPDATVFARAEMERIMEAAQRESAMKYSKDIMIDCVKDKGSYYAYDSPKIECTVKNLGNFPFKALDVCFEDKCEKADLPIAQEKTFEHVIEKPEHGVSKLLFSVEGDDLSKSEFIDLDVSDPPEIVIEDIEYPSEIEFGQPFKVEFVIKKKSVSVPEDIKVVFEGIGREKVFEENELEGNKKYIMELDSSDLSLDPNRFVMTAEYYDRNDKLYTVYNEIEIALVNVTFGQKMVIWLKDADRWIRGLFD